MSDPLRRLASSRVRQNHGLDLTIEPRSRALACHSGALALMVRRPASSFETLALMVRRPASSFETLALLAPQDEAGPRTTLAPQDEALMLRSARSARLEARLHHRVPRYSSTHAADALA